MEILALFVFLIMIPHVLLSAVKVGTVFFKTASYIVGAAIFGVGLLALLGALLS